LERHSIISELENSYHRRRAEHWFMVVTIMVVILAIAAGLSYSLGNSLGITTELIIWGSALAWIFIFTAGHVKEMSRLKREEQQIIAKLEKDVKYKYTEKPESPHSRWGGAIFALILGCLLIYASVNVLFMDGFGRNLSSDSTAEITIILFASILALVGAFSRIFPFRQKYYNVRVSVLDKNPAMFKYRMRRLS